MSGDTFDTVPVRPGYPWSVQILDPKPHPDLGALFPIGSTFRSNIRQGPSNSPPIAVLTTANGGVIREDDCSLILSLSAAVTSLLESGRRVKLDLIRDDLPAPEHTNIEIHVPVR